MGRRSRQLAEESDPLVGGGVVRMGNGAELGIEAGRQIEARPVRWGVDGDDGRRGVG